MRTDKWLKIGWVGGLVIGLGLVIVWFFMQIDTTDNTLGIDNIFYALQDWTIRYDVVNGLRNPPWSVLPLLPLGQLPAQAAWGLLVYITLIAMLLSVPTVPNKWRYLAAVLLLVISFPSLRNIADANLEGLLIAGAVLTVVGFQRQHPLVLALGVLLITVKPQTCFLLLPVLALYVLRTWPVVTWLKTAALVLAVVGPTLLWRGADWIAAVRGTYQANSIIDISVSAALERTGVVPAPLIWAVMTLLFAVTAVVALRGQPVLDREKAALLMVTSMLLAPYVAGNSMATVLAVGIIPLFLVAPGAGGLLLALVNVPFLFLGNFDVLFAYQSYWWTLILVLCWLIFNWRIYRREIAAPVQAVAATPPAHVETGRA